MYYKRCTGRLLIRELTDPPDWVMWVHHASGKTHCEECLKLDGCWFSGRIHPPCPHHPFCHCTLEPIDYAIVLERAAAHSAYSKFDPYLFDPDGSYDHGKNRAFELWGYSVADSQWLKDEMERQATAKYISGDYSLGVLNKHGQRISIRIEIPRKNGIGNVSFITGWAVLPGGQLKLNTPYGGK